MKILDPNHAEIKSMRTAVSERGKGVASAYFTRSKTAWLSMH